MSATPTFRVTVISRSVQAVNYEHRSGSSKLDFAGTGLMPSATGEAHVNSKRGSISIDAYFGNLQRPITFGNEYLTYVLWAISPEGRAVNLGEVLVGDDAHSKLHVTTDLQAFALIVTAEPYYAVRQPSNVVVLENVVREDTKGTSEAVNAKYELMERGGYLPTGYKFDPVVMNAKLPLEFFEARNALRIAQSEGAERFASDSYKHAVRLMDDADAGATRKHMERKPLIAVSREVVQTAEDAREIAVKKMGEERLSNERQASADSLSQSRAETDDATRQREQARSDQSRAEIGRQQAESDAARSRADAENAQSVADQARADNANAQSSIVQARADAADAQSATIQARNDAANAQSASIQARSDATDAQSATARARSDMADNRAASASALAAAQADADQSRVTALNAQNRAQQADADKAAMRAKLSEQLNSILQTRDSARGLIVSMSDVLFDTGRFSLKPGAREK